MTNPRTARARIVTLAVAGTALLGGRLAAADAPGGGVSGTYLEARTADVYTGPCFANSEVNLAGKEAVLAWHVERGDWDGVPLAGLSVVAVVSADATLGDPFAQPRSRSVLLVDERADEEQRAALVEMAKGLSGGLLADVISIESAPVEMAVEHHGHGSVRAGEVALRTRSLHEGDHLCGNEEVYYPPLAAGVDAHPAVTLEHTWSGDGLGKSWKSPDKRGAFAGTFTVP
ncbi:MAG TPA: DUF1326 domain-containing protein [Thermoanaerobaculia bacterium]|nr:DUF1326 domain-containing protein [Thermoanaerobaculia bacterium]